MSDLDRLVALTRKGYAFSLLFDDNGHWACVGDGFQNWQERKDGAQVAYEMGFVIDDPEMWCDTPSEAITKAEEMVKKLEIKDGGM